MQSALGIKVWACFITAWRAIFLVVYMCVRELNMPIIKLCQFLSNIYKLKSTQTTHEGATLVEI